MHKKVNTTYTTNAKKTNTKKQSCHQCNYDLIIILCKGFPTVIVNRQWSDIEDTQKLYNYKNKIQWYRLSTQKVFDGSNHNKDIFGFVKR